MEKDWIQSRRSRGAGFAAHSNERERLPTKPAASTGHLRTFWTAAGSEAPRRFHTHQARGLFDCRRPLESAVAATLCPRSPKGLFRHRRARTGLVQRKNVRLMAQAALA